MSTELIHAVEQVVATVVQEFQKDASVVVQFSAGEWHNLKTALVSAKQLAASSSSPTADAFLPPLRSVAPSGEEEVASPTDHVGDDL